MSHEGVELPFERDERVEERRSSVAGAHAARIVGDCIHFTTLRLLAIYRFLNLPKDPLKAAQKRHEPLMADLDAAAREWHAIEYPDFSAVEAGAGMDC